MRDLSGLSLFRVFDDVIFDESAWSDFTSRWNSASHVQRHSVTSVLSASPSVNGDSVVSPIDPRVDSKAEAEKAPPTPLVSPLGGQPNGPLFAGDAIGDNTSSSTTLTIGGSLSSLIDSANDL